jgi:S-adenosylmethionine decarboxylase
MIHAVSMLAANQPGEGLHLLGDLAECAVATACLGDEAWLKDLVVREVRGAGLTVVGTAFHSFTPEGVTGCVLLAESHVCIHTWPTEAYASMDIYVCNHTQDNSHLARRVFDAIARALGSRMPAMEIRRASRERRRIAA